jgi:hypothetical protein
VIDFRFFADDLLVREGRAMPDSTSLSLLMTIAFPFVGVLIGVRFAFFFDGV